MGLIASPIILKIIILLESFFRLNSLTGNEYNKSRGTLHKKLLKEHIGQLKKNISKEEAKLKKQNDLKSNNNKEKNLELEKAATKHIFHKEFTSIPGIGPKLKQRIEHSVFNGNLDSLYRSYRVQGIGDQKYSLIRRWVDNKKHSMPHILQSNFSGKKEIEDKYGKIFVKIENEIKKIDDTLKPMYSLKKQAESEHTKLEKITIATFKQSYNGDENSSKLVTEYHLGLFPEWSRMPTWFKELMEIS